MEDHSFANRELLVCRGHSWVGEVTCVPRLPVLGEVPDVGGVAHRCAWVMSVWCRAQMCVGHSCLPSADPSSHGLLGQHLTLLSSRPSPPWPGALGKPSTSVPSSTMCITITLVLLPPRLFSPFPAITSQKDEGSLYNLHGHGFGGLASAGSAPRVTPSPRLHASQGNKLHCPAPDSVSTSSVHLLVPCQPQGQGSLLVWLTDASPAASPALAGECSVCLLNRRVTSLRQFSQGLLQGCPFCFCLQQPPDTPWTCAESQVSSASSSLCLCFIPGINFSKLNTESAFCRIPPPTPCGWAALFTTCCF